MRKLYLLTLKDHVKASYDCYDAQVVCANSEDDARMMCLLGDESERTYDYENRRYVTSFNPWLHDEHVTCTWIGDASPHQWNVGVVCASFNAG